jgi:tyrosine-protein kinase Etk/Wzc
LLSRDAKIKEMLYELLTREYEVAKIEEAKSMPTIQVLDSAVVPEKKCRPKRAQIVMLASVTALFVSVFAAFVREHFARISLSYR